MVRRRLSTTSFPRPCRPMPAASAPRADAERTSPYRGPRGERAREGSPSLRARPPPAEQPAREAGTPRRPRFGRLPLGRYAARLPLSSAEGALGGLLSGASGVRHLASTGPEMAGDGDIRNFFQPARPSSAMVGASDSTQRRPARPKGKPYAPHARDIRKGELDARWDWAADGGALSPHNIQRAYGLESERCADRWAGKLGPRDTSSREDGEAAEPPAKRPRSSPSPAVSDASVSLLDAPAKDKGKGPARKPPQPRCAAQKCGSNPLCLNHMGQDRWLAPKAMQEYLRARDLPAEVALGSGGPVGLLNLGATCYLATALQLWFHDRELRDGILACRPPANANPVLPALQLLLALLLPPSLSPVPDALPLRAIDPGFLVDLLGVPRGEQQDAQEFGKVLTGLLEHSDRAVGEVLRSRFEGTQDYVVRCSGCGGESRREGKWTEIELALVPPPGERRAKGKEAGEEGTKAPPGTSLEEALGRYIGSEDLVGENAYACERCGGKRNAERWTELGQLPPVLNFQLMRFVYDLASGTKKKVKAAIRFPEKLDMRPYLPDGGAGRTAEECEYELQGVLVHRGPGAYSGHYIAHAWDETTGKWHKLDDDTVTEMPPGARFDVEEPGDKDDKKPAKKPAGKKGGKPGAGGTIDLTGDDDAPADEPEPEAPASTSAANANAKGVFTSRNAYTLSYVRTADKLARQSLPAAPPAVPDGVQEELARRQAELARARDEREGRREELERGFAGELEGRKEVWGRWGWDGGEAGVWVPGKWLEAWSGGVLLRKPRKGAAAKEEEGGKEEGAKEGKGKGPIETVDLDAEPEEGVAPAAEGNGTADDGKLALPEDAGADKPASPERPASPDVPESPSAADLRDEIPMEAIMCEHGKANVAEVSNAKVISQAGMDALLARFPEVRLPVRLTTDDSLCEICVETIRTEIARAKRHAEDAEKFQQLLKAGPGRAGSWWIGQSWMREFRKKNPEWDFVGHFPAPYDEPYRSEVFCLHDGIVADTSTLVEISEAARRLISTVCPTWVAESTAREACVVCSEAAEKELLEGGPLKNQAKEDKRTFQRLLKTADSNEFRISRIRKGEQQFLVSMRFVDALKAFSMDPLGARRPQGIENAHLLCPHGNLLWDLQEEVDREDGLKKEFHVVEEDQWNALTASFGNPDHTIFLFQNDDGLATLPECCAECRRGRLLEWSSTNIVVKKRSPPVEAKGKAAGKGKAEPIQLDDSEDELTRKAPKTSVSRGSTGTRSSKRLAPNSYRIRVDKGTTLRDLKVLIMAQSKATPIYQRLFLENGTELTENSATMQSIGIVPNQVLELEVFEESSGAADGISDEPPPSRRVERGFKGTGLYGFEGGNGNAAPAAAPPEALEDFLPQDMSEEKAIDEAIRMSMVEAGLGNGTSAAGRGAGDRKRPPADDDPEEDDVVPGPSSSRKRRNVLDSSPEAEPAKPPTPPRRIAATVDLLSDEDAPKAKANGVKPVVRALPRPSAEVSVEISEDDEAPQTIGKKRKAPRSSAASHSDCYDRSSGEDDDASYAPRGGTRRTSRGRGRGRVSGMNGGARRVPRRSGSEDLDEDVEMA